MNHRFWLTLASLFISAIVLAAGKEKGDEGDDAGRPAAETGADGLPVFRHPYTDGLYSTVTAMNMFYVPEEDLERLKKSKLKVPGFKKDFPIHTIMQNYDAPLLVVLLGVDGKVSGAFGGLFPYWYSEAGYHVLTFDSSFTPQYAELSGQGVVGNFDAEADQIAQVVAAFMKTPEAKKVTQIGVVGISFGGTQALQLAVKAKEGKLPFELSGCLALCPPLRMKTAAKTVDRFFAEDRWDTTMVELAKKFGPHAPVAEGQPIPFSASEMRAAIGFVFRDGLTEVVERNDRFYKLKLLPSEESGEHRGSYAEAISFTRFMEEYTFPFWQKKGAFKTVDDVWASCDVTKMLPKLPPWAEVIVAANDPFISKEDITEAQAADKNKNLIVLPRGGHLGFISADWTLVKALRIFKRKAGGAKVSDEAPAFEDPRSRDQMRKEALDAVDEALKREVPPADKDKKDAKRERK
ncbi:MAG TPA: alpha/beta fold hydrolase [Planctomycetota bacterium]|nr:alpha/beta fold hydrolase [Planctomycetota bacterium]